MSKKEKYTDYEASLKGAFDRWDHLIVHGGSDPSFADGVNMNLVRCHIEYYKGKIEETLPPYPEIYYKETPPEVEPDYMARPDEIRENAKIFLMQIEGNDSLQYLKNELPNLSEKQIKQLCIHNILGYETTLRRAISDDDLIVMRRYENPERYIESFDRAAEAVRQLEPEENFQMKLF